MRQKKVLAIASGGGHWVQLLRLRPAFDGCEVTFASVQPGSADEVPGHRYHAFRDASRKNRVAFAVAAWQIFWIVVRTRPEVIVTTGSAPALLALLFGRALGARTLWIDSIANVRELSASGRTARRVAHGCISQWPEVARANGLDYWGRTL